MDFSKQYRVWKRGSARGRYGEPQKIFATDDSDQIAEYLERDDCFVTTKEFDRRFHPHSKTWLQMVEEIA